MRQFISDLTSVVAHPLFTGLASLVTGYFIGIQTDRFKDLRTARIGLITAIDRELAAFSSRERDNDVSNASAVNQLKAAATQYLGCLFWPGSKSRFKRQWNEYEQEIDNRDFREEGGPNFESFGYRNYFNTADVLKAIRKRLN